jgi:DNA repair exonuclease SbcCD ATPase subunit
MLRAKESEINAVFIAESKAITGALAELGLVHKQLESQCNAKITSLQAKGLAGSITELQNLLTRRQALTLEIGAITNAQPGLAQLRKDREEKCKQLADVREQITARRKGQLVAINKNLARTIQDYSVFVHFEPAGITTKFKEFILEKMQGTYFQEETANEFCSKISPAQLAMLMFAGDINGISVAGGVTTEWAAQIWDKLKYYSTIHALEVMWKTPYPIITVKSKGTPPKIIPVNQLSDGQKHTIMLTIAMLAESNIPLIIDQPEDDLDNAFIFSAVVRVLRAIKEHRQVVLVTHNANIAVLGDAELLLPMKRSGDCGAAFDRGSIDAAETKRAVINILEGGDRAFQRRREIYRH